MRRGRWVVCCLGLFLFFFSVHTSYGASLGMSAIVPLSPLWKEAMQKNSQAQTNTSHAHILLVSQESLGIENIPVEKQAIQLLVFKNNVLVNEQIKITNKKGVVDFIFVPEQSGSYLVLVVNKSDENPFVVKSASIAL